MKGDKKILILALLVLLLSVCFSTYAIYRNTANGTGSIKAANWSVLVKGTDIATANFNFTAADITWTTRTGYNNTIAPGSVGYIEIPVDADGSEVDVILTAALDTTNLPDRMTASVDGGETKNIAYSETEGAMETKVKINITWAGDDTDTTAKDTTDLAVEDTTLSLPVTLTAKQSVANH